MVSVNGRASAEELGVRAGAEPVTFKQSVATVTLDPKNLFVLQESLNCSLIYVLLMATGNCGRDGGRSSPGGVLCIISSDVPLSFSTQARARLGLTGGYPFFFVCFSFRPESPSNLEVKVLFLSGCGDTTMTVA